MIGIRCVESSLSIREIIKVNQDPLGIQGRLVVTDQSNRVYSRPLQNSDVAVALLNTGEDGSPRNTTFSFKAVSLFYLATSCSVITYSFAVSCRLG